MQRDASLLLDMFRATSQIVQFKGELTFERFRTDAKTHLSDNTPVPSHWRGSKINFRRFQNEKSNDSMVGYGTYAR